MLPVSPFDYVAVFILGTLFGSFSPTIAGVLADNFGVLAAFHWAAAIALVAALLFTFAAGSREPAPA